MRKFVPPYWDKKAQPVFSLHDYMEFSKPRWNLKIGKLIKLSSNIADVTIKYQKELFHFYLIYYR